MTGMRGVSLGCSIRTYTVRRRKGVIGVFRGFLLRHFFAISKLGHVQTRGREHGWKALTLFLNLFFIYESFFLSRRQKCLTC